MEEYWPMLSVVVIALFRFLNSKTKHWSDWPWYGRVFGLILEVLDLWRPPEIRKKQ